jgi:hypothetical protein
MLNHFTPFGWATPETVLWLFQDGQPVAVFYSFGHPTPFAYALRGTLLNKDNPNQTHACLHVILNKKEDCPFVIRASKFNDKISLFQKQKASNF